MTGVRVALPDHSSRPFDYDNPAPPVLTDITVDGRRIKALAQVTKQSFTVALDRTNGKPVRLNVETSAPVERSR